MPSSPISRRLRGRRVAHRGQLTLSVCVLAVLSCAAAAQAAGDYGPDTCLDGFVWREARSTDHVCVTPATRIQTLSDNAQAATRRSPTGGAYGPDTCLSGYVWREAFAGDHVCVTDTVRSQVAADTAQGAARRNSLNLWLTTYTIPPHCTGFICTIESGDNLPHFAIHADHINRGWATVELRRLDTNALRHSWKVYAPPAYYTPGGRLDLNTGFVDCRGAADSYFRIRDPLSTRWSAPRYVSSICNVL